MHSPNLWSYYIFKLHARFHLFFLIFQILWRSLRGVLHPLLSLSLSELNRSYRQNGAVDLRLLSPIENMIALNNCYDNSTFSLPQIVPSTALATPEDRYTTFAGSCVLGSSSMQGKS